MKKLILSMNKLGLLSAIIIVGSIYGYAYARTNKAILNPKSEHLHFRIQIEANGEAVNFASEDFQEGYAKDQCKVDLSDDPFHFHDSKDQIAHVHWQNMTGGLFLKFYGWNYIGGMNGALGLQRDGVKLSRVELFGDSLPELQDNEKFFVYIGDQNGYVEKKWNDFLKQDLESFFGKKSNLRDATSQNWLDRIFSSNTNATENLEEAELEQINNLIGNVVIFAQKDRPSDSQIKEKFNNLVPLERSTCGG